MSSIRYVLEVAEADSFSDEDTTKKNWLGLPPGATMSHTHNVSTEMIYSAGSKKPDTVIWGGTSETWEISFTMDYSNLGLLSMIFDEHSVSTKTMTINGKQETRYLHTFSKLNNQWVKPFIIRRTTRNAITDPTSSDEVTVFSGCVAKSLRISFSSGSSKASVTISGIGRKPITTLTAATATYQQYQGHPVEFSCMFYGDDYVANVESLTVGVDIGTAVRRSTCTATPVGYYEGTTSFQVGFTAYSNDPKRYLLRVYSGGQDPSKALVKGTQYAPMCKNKVPIPELTMTSFNTCCGEVANEDNTSRPETIQEAIGRADLYMNIKVKGIVAKSYTWQKGDGRLIDQMSSAECMDISIEVLSDKKGFQYGPDPAGA